MQSSEKPYVIGVARDHRWMRLAEQKDRLAQCCDKVVVLGGSNNDNRKGCIKFEHLVRMIRPGDELNVVFAFLIATPVHVGTSKLSKVRKPAFKQAVATIVDKRKATLRDLSNGLSTETPAKRMAFMAAGADQIARNNRGTYSAQNGSRSPGRPSPWMEPANRQVIWEEWHSSLNRTNGAAAEAVYKRTGYTITPNRMWNIVKQERAARGIEGKGGSGRRPNLKALEVAQGSKKSRGHVYFIQPGSRKRVKIGFAVSVPERMAMLQTASSDKLRLLGTIKGDLTTEGEMHRRFAQHRIQGEWFRLVSEIVEYIAELKAK